MTITDAKENRDYVVFDGQYARYDRVANNLLDVRTADYGYFQGSRFRGSGAAYRGSFRMVAGSGFHTWRRERESGGSFRYPESTTAAAKVIYMMPATATHGGNLRWDTMEFGCYYDNDNFTKFTFDAKYTPSKAANIQYPTDLRWVAAPAVDDVMDCWLILYQRSNPNWWSDDDAVPHCIRFPVTVSHDGTAIKLSTGDITSETGLKRYNNTAQLETFEVLTDLPNSSRYISWHKWLLSFHDSYVDDSYNDAPEHWVWGLPNAYPFNNYRQNTAYTIVLAKRGTSFQPFPNPAPHTVGHRLGFEPYVYFHQYNPAYNPSAPVPVHPNITDFTNTRQFGDPDGLTLGDRTDRILLTWRQGSDPEPGDSRFEIQYKLNPSLTDDWVTLESAYVDGNIPAHHTHRYFFYPENLETPLTLHQGFQFRIRAARSLANGQPNPDTWSNYSTTLYVGEGISRPLYGAPWADDYHYGDPDDEKFSDGGLGLLEETSVALFGMTPTQIGEDFFAKHYDWFSKVLDFTGDYVMTDAGVRDESSDLETQILPLPQPGQIAKFVLTNASDVIEALGDIEINDQEVSSSALPILATGLDWLADTVASPDGLALAVSVYVGNRLGIAGRVTGLATHMTGKGTSPESVQKWTENMTRQDLFNLRTQQNILSDSLKNGSFDTKMVALHGSVWYNEKRRMLLKKLITGGNNV